MSSNLETRIRELERARAVVDPHAIAALIRACLAGRDRVAEVVAELELARGGRRLPERDLMRASRTAKQFDLLAHEMNALTHPSNPKGSKTHDKGDL